MKQSAHRPLDVAKQVVILYALAHHLLEDIPLNELRLFEKELYDYIEQGSPDILDDIRTQTVITDEERLTSTIKDYVDIFLSSYHAQIDSKE